MIVRLSGVTLPPKKQISIALQYIYGVGKARALALLKTAGIHAETRTDSLTEDEVSKLRASLEQSGRPYEGELRREILSHIRRLKEIGSYRGSRHAKNLPVRGQRSKTNSRTVRGNVRRTMTSGRKPAAQKT